MHIDNKERANQGAIVEGQIVLYFIDQFLNDSHLSVLSLFHG